MECRPGRFHNRWNRDGFVQVSHDSTSPTDGSIVNRYGTWAYYPIDGTFLPSNTTALEYRPFALSSTMYNGTAI